jgi:tRNA nucleotidyltransferase/poly(A) polymerase
MDLAGPRATAPIPTGLDHGTVTASAPAAIEVTTLRRDEETSAATPPSPSAPIPRRTRSAATSP